MEHTLISDLQELNSYFHKWRLKLNPNKTVSSTFHLANRLAYLQLNMRLNNALIKHEPHPKYLGITLDRSLTFKPHLTHTAEKIQARCNLLRKLASQKWGASFHVLRTSILALNFSVAEYCAPVWHHSAHTELVDTALNSAMRLVTGCIRPTPTSQLSILSGIAPPDLRREAQCLNLLARAEATPNHLMRYITEKNMCSQPRLRRQTLSNRLCALRVEAQTASPNAWPLQRWTDRWEREDCQLRNFIPRPTTHPPGSDLPRASLVQLNRLRSGYGRFRQFLFRIGLASSELCDCGEVQSGNHILSCRILGPQGDMALVDDHLPQWLREERSNF